MSYNSGTAGPPIGFAAFDTVAAQLVVSLLRRPSVDRIMIHKMRLYQRLAYLPNYQTGTLCEYPFEKTYALVTTGL